MYVIEIIIKDINNKYKLLSNKDIINTKVIREKLIKLDSVKSIVWLEILFFNLFF